MWSGLSVLALYQTQRYKTQKGGKVVGIVIYELLNHWRFLQQCEQECREVEEEFGEGGYERFECEDSKVLPFKQRLSLSQNTH